MIEQCLRLSLNLKINAITKNMVRNMLEIVTTEIKEDLKLEMIENTEDLEKITLLLLNPITHNIFAHSKKLMRLYFEALDPKMQTALSKKSSLAFVEPQKSVLEVMSNDF